MREEGREENLETMNKEINVGAKNHVSSGRANAHVKKTNLWNVMCVCV